MAKNLDRSQFLFARKFLEIQAKEELALKPKFLKRKPLGQKDIQREKIYFFFVPTQKE